MGAAPLSFKCAMLRRVYYKDQHLNRALHVVARTGRERPHRVNGTGSRCGPVSREYRCACGHVGWSSHYGLERCPVVVGGAGVESPRA